MSSPITEVKPSQVAQLMKENAKLKEENENKKTIMDIDSFIDELEKVCECTFTGYMKCLEKVKELKAENEKLKQDTDVLVKGMETLQNKYMNECSPKLIAERDTYKMKNDKLKAENEKLKNKTLDNPQKSFDAMCKVVVELQDQIKTLKEENEELEEQVTELEEMGTEYDPRVDKLVDKEWLEKLKEEKEKLKAENEKLKKMTDALDEQATDFCLQNKKLKEEIEELKFNIRANNIEVEFMGLEHIDMKEFNEHLKDRHPDMYEKLYDYFDMDNYIEDEE